MKNSKVNYNWLVGLKAKFKLHPSNLKTSFFEFLSDHLQTLGKEMFDYFTRDIFIELNET